MCQPAVKGNYKTTTTTKPHKMLRKEKEQIIKRKLSEEDSVNLKCPWLHLRNYKRL